MGAASRRTSGCSAIALAATALLLAGPASATRIELSMDASRDPDIKSLGTFGDSGLIFGWRYSQVPVQSFTARVFADDGTPVTDTCLTGARLELLDDALVSRLGSMCTNSAGVWQFVLTTTRVRTPTVLTAQLLGPATTTDGRTLSPGASNTVALMLAPLVVNTSPRVSVGPAFPVSGMVRAPRPRALGVVVLQKRTGGWKTLATKRTDAAGRFRFSVARGRMGTTERFRVRYLPTRTSGWLPGTLYIAIGWR